MGAQFEMVSDPAIVERKTSRVTSEKPDIRRILHVTEAPLGGVVSCLEELVRSQVDRDVDYIEVITPEINRSAIKKTDNENLKINSMEFSRKSIPSLFRAARLVLKNTWATRPDIVHAHSSFAGLVVRSVKPFMPKQTKVVYCPHAWAFAREGDGVGTRAFAFLERVLSYFSDAIICVSDYERTEALAVGIAADKLHVIENGISLHNLEYSKVRDPNETRKVVAFVGRFDRQKGFDIYVEVMRQLQTEARGIVIGGAIVNSPEEYDIPDNVEILGWQPREKVLELYRQADVLVMPSRWEAFGLVAVEAMQAGLAVFASRSGGLQDVVVDRETGRLFDIGEVDAIVEAIRETSVETLIEYGKAGYYRCGTRYSAERMNDQVWSLYRNLVARSS